MIDQLEAFDNLMESLSDRGVGKDLCTRDFIEAMAENGLVFAHGTQTEAIKQMDTMDADVT